MARKAGLLGPARQATLLETIVVIVALSIAGVGLIYPSPQPPTPVKLIGAPTGDVLQVPSLKVQAPLVSVKMSKDAQLDPPRNPRQVGYWSGSSAPGALTGQTLVTGHTVHTGGGALDKLGTVKVGQPVVIFRKYSGQVQRTKYRITSVKTYSKKQIATQAPTLFGQDRGKGRLLLITCTGWDGQEYHGNTLVTAKRLGTEVAALRA
ncbi:hypothetical protein GCM10011519_16260 [Marmoricola endophyticus]|uniref:Class F sortase n=1 Tax=Marmoricola endophyticus TaxID=2040280 RepID=A0A917BHP0_9ACTN|nr:class F sortase [Marmoricola endophyticus]GGF43130.1 hypothetical protein GCM10011519_16260 [Marmoricola endophyticus]